MRPANPLEHRGDCSLRTVAGGRFESPEKFLENSGKFSRTFLKHFFRRGRYAGKALLRVRALPSKSKHQIDTEHLIECTSIFTSLCYMHHPLIHFWFRLDRRSITAARRPSPLTPKAFETLLVLVQNSGHLVEKARLMKRCGPTALSKKRILTAHLEAEEGAQRRRSDHQYIETIRSVAIGLSQA